VRRLILALLLFANVGLFVRLPSMAAPDRAFDPLAPRGREVERAIAERQFERALPIARELQVAHPAEPVVAFWLAEVLHGLNQFADEASQWERVRQLTNHPDAVCPAIAEAYAHAGDDERALDRYEQCATDAAADAERWFDLAQAYAARGRAVDATRAYERSRALDPTNPRLPAPATSASREASE